MKFQGTRHALHLPGERFADTIARLGFENVEQAILSDDILTRKDEILKA